MNDDPCYTRIFGPNSHFRRIQQRVVPAKPRFNVTGISTAPNHRINVNLMIEIAAALIRNTRWSLSSQDSHVDVNHCRTIGYTYVTRGFGSNAPRVQQSCTAILA
jgi:hypothetical protein